MRIVSLAPSNTEILWSIGAGEEIVGNTMFCDYPAKAKEKNLIGSWLNPNIDSILSLEPDLVVSSMYIPEDVQSDLAQNKIKHLHVNPLTLNGVMDSFVQIGNATGHLQEALQLVEMFKESIEEAAAKQNDSRKKVYVEEWSNPPTASGNWVPELVNLAGGVSISKAGMPSMPISFQELKTFDPDVVIISIAGNKNQTADIFNKREHCDELRVVKEEHVFVIDESLLNRPGPRLALGLKQLTKILA